MRTAKALSTSSSGKGSDFKSFLECSPARKQRLSKLHDLFQQRAFLPELKDVRRFLERHVDEPPMPRSRERGRKIVFELLATISEDRFNRIYDEALMRAGGKGDLAIVADAILKRRDG